MSQHRDYEIAFVGLTPGIHEFEFKIEDRFFEAYRLQDFRECHAIVKLQLNKQPGFLLLKFEIGGTLEVTCDRCNSDLPLQLFDEFCLTVKMADDPEVLNEQEEDPDVYYISRTESHIRVDDWIYEFINLSIPMHKICTFEKMDGPYCNPTAKKILNILEEENENIENPRQNARLNNDKVGQESFGLAIWKGLDKFR